MEEAKTKKRGLLKRLKRYRWDIFNIYDKWLLTIFFVAYFAIALFYGREYFDEILRHLEGVPNADEASIYDIEEAYGWAVLSTILLILLLEGYDKLFYTVVGFFKDDVWWRPSFLYLFPRLLMVIILIASEMYFILFRDGYYLIMSINLAIFLLMLTDIIRFVIWVIRKALGK